LAPLQGSKVMCDLQVRMLRIRKVVQWNQCFADKFFTASGLGNRWTYALMIWYADINLWLYCVVEACACHITDDAKMNIFNRRIKELRAHHLCVQGVPRSVSCNTETQSTKSQFIWRYTVDNKLDWLKLNLRLDESNASGTMMLCLAGPGNKRKSVSQGESRSQRSFFSHISRYLGHRHQL